VVGSEDFDIRVFREDEILAEMTETEVCMYCYSRILLCQDSNFNNCQIQGYDVRINYMR